MRIEQEIFKRTIFDFEKLKNYGFFIKGNNYEYSKKIMDTFEATIVISKNGEIKGRIYDCSSEEEYTNLRYENQNGEFVSKVREEYQNLLEDIRKNCCNNLYFTTKQANRIANALIERYHDEPEFLWEKYPDFGIFRNSSSNKWYALMMNIDRSKLDKSSEGKVEVINVKLEENRIQELLSRRGFYPSYHMNKKNWITILLDDTLEDDEILEYIEISHSYTVVLREWIVPANPKYYDVISAFQKKDVIEWKQSSAIKVGDLVYLYVAIPYSAILYKCKAIDVNIPYHYQDKNLSMSRVMKIQLLEKYDKNEYSFSKLKEYGIHAIRGPRRMPEKLSKDMNKEKI